MFRPLLHFLCPGSPLDWWMKAKAGFSLVFAHLELSVCGFIRWVPSKHFSLKGKKKSFTYTYFCGLICHSGYSLGQVFGILNFNLSDMWNMLVPDKVVQAAKARSQLLPQKSTGHFFFLPFVWVCMFPYLPITVSIFPVVYNCLCVFTSSPRSWIFIRSSSWSWSVARIFSCIIQTRSDSADPRCQRTSSEPHNVCEDISAC